MYKVGDTNKQVEKVNSQLEDINTEIVIKQRGADKQTRNVNNKLNCCISMK